eukprot:scaffold35875_cov112-Isochrysis_galbana.AAC.6
MQINLQQPLPLVPTFTHPTPPVTVDFFFPNPRPDHRSDHLLPLPHTNPESAKTSSKLAALSGLSRIARLRSALLQPAQPAASSKSPSANIGAPAWHRKSLEPTCEAAARAVEHWRGSAARRGAAP